MNPRFTFDDPQPAPTGSPDQRELIRLARAVRDQLAKRAADLGCMNPNEMIEYLDALDQAMDLQVWASLYDDRIASAREKLQRAVWNDE